MNSYHTNTRHRLSIVLAGLGLATAAVGVLAQAPSLDTKPAFMQIVTNYTFRTNAVIVTNYVVITNAVVTTNYYNAQGQLLMPVAPAPPPIPGLIPIPPTKPAGPDPVAVKAGPLQAVRDLLVQGLLAVSNQLSGAGSFTSNATQQIQIPQGITAFDRKRSQALLLAMNVTAEKAAPEAVALWIKTAAQIKTDQPEAVIKGDKDAAARLLQDQHREELMPQVLAMVQRAGAEAKLHEAYNSVMLRGGGLVGSLLGSGPSVDIDAHVTQGLLRAIAGRLAEQEEIIRTRADARKTPALREAFGK